MDCGFEEDDELLLSDGEILKSVCKQNELTEKFFEEEVCSDAAKKGYRFLERSEVYNNRFALYFIVALFADCEGNYCMTLSDFSKIIFYYRGDEEVCRTIFERAKKEKDSFASLCDEYVTEKSPLLNSIAERFKINIPPSKKD